MSTDEKKLNKYINAPEDAKAPGYIEKMENCVAPYITLEIGSRIELVRVKMLLSQKEMGEMLGVTQSCLSKIECGRMDIAPFSLARLRAVFGKHTHFILFGTGEPNQWNSAYLHTLYWKVKLKDKRKPGSGLWKKKKVQEDNEKYWAEREARLKAEARAKKSENSGS